MTNSVRANLDLTTARLGAVKPPGTRRWIPLSLRMFLVMLVILGSGSALVIGVPAYRQRAAIQVIEHVHGKVGVIPRGAAWLRAWVGEELMENFDEIGTVCLHHKQATDSTVHQISCLTGLYRLDLGYTSVSDSGLVYLRDLKKLESLHLAHTCVSDTGLIYLRGLTQLEYIDLADTQVSDAGLMHLLGLANLQFLRLNRTQVSDAGLAQIKLMVGLQELSLDGTHVSDAGLVHLTGMPKLKEVSFSDTRVTDAGVAELQRAIPGLKVFFYTISDR